MATRWRVTWTRERRKKKPKKFDGELVVDESGRATLYETREAEDGDGGDGNAETTPREVTSEKLRRDVVEAMEAGADVHLGAQYGVYLDERVEEGERRDGGEVGTSGGGGAAATAARAKRHRFVNPAFHKKFVPPMLKKPKTTAETRVVARASTREDENEEALKAERPVGDLAKALLALGGFEAVKERLSLDDDLDLEDEDKPLACRVVDNAPNVARVDRQKSVVAQVKKPPARPRRAPNAPLSAETRVTAPPHDYDGVTFQKTATFASVSDYQSYFISAACENLSLRLRDVSIKLKKTRDESSAEMRAEPKLPILANMLNQRFKLRYFFKDCKIVSRKYCKTEEREEQIVVRLHVPGWKSMKGKGKRPYTKGDVWLVSTDPWFEVKSSREIGDRANAPWVGVVECTWFGPSKDGEMNVRLLSPRPRRFTDNCSMNVFALHTPLNAFSEFEELQAISNLSKESTSPMLTSLLGNPPPEEREEEQELYLNDSEIGVAALKRQFTLNDDQARAVSSALASATSVSPFPIRLVHGPFGSGKTHTIAAFVIKAVEQLKSSNGRIMISAHTNVAVDRVLQSLLNLGFTDFVRIGSVRKIDPSILPYSIHAKQKCDGLSHVKELEAMLGEASTARTRAILEQEIKSICSDKSRSRKGLLKKCSVVGVTCYSSSHEFVKNMEFSVVVLDECSQMTEPSSVLPIVNSRCKTLLAFGDPLQLPPLVETVPEKENTTSTRNPLMRTLFSRLSAVGHPTLTLRTQYRLHPMLSAIPNKCFYDGVLIDGVNAIDRSGLISLAPRGVLPPILWWDTIGYDEKEGESKINVNEATRVTSVVRCLLDNGVSAEKIGVIAFYAAQAKLVSSKLESFASDAPTMNVDGDDAESFSPADVQVSTVDAFQGQEKEIIIFTLCGAPQSTFTTAERLNVALTRAKRHLVVVGQAAVAQKSNEPWREVLRCARTNAHGFVPSRLDANAILQKWRPATTTACADADNILLSPSSEIELSQDFIKDRVALLELGFDRKQYWEFHCAVMRAVNYDHEESRELVQKSALMPLLRRLYPKAFAADGSFKWNKAKARRTLTADAVGLLRRFIEHEHGAESVTLTNLINAFENREEFERDPTGFGWLCLQEAEGAHAVGAAEWSRADYVPADPSFGFSDDEDHDAEDHDAADDSALLSP